jgi:hypothetical protein
VDHAARVRVSQRVAGVDESSEQFAQGEPAFDRIVAGAALVEFLDRLLKTLAADEAPAP